MLRLCALGLALLLSLAWTPTASALTAATNGACVAAGPPLGQADQIDDTAGGAPYNNDKTDDALICIDQFFADAVVNTAGEFQIEVANTTSHELGHLLGLEHGDATAAPASLMIATSPFEGNDRSFNGGAEKGVLDALANDVQVVWLDFEAAQPGLLSIYRPFSQAAVLAQYGIGPGDVAGVVASIVAAIQADYTGPWAGGASFEFYTLEIDALNATSGVGDYTTVSLVAIPEPATASMVLLGTAALVLIRRRRLR
jgi:hypothetical protein